MCARHLGDIGAADLHSKTVPRGARLSRAIHLADVMLFVLATAVSIVATRSCLEEMQMFHHGFNNLGNWFIIASPSVMSVTLVLLLIGLIDHPPELFRRPGFVACWVTALAMALRLSVNFISIADHRLFADHPLKSLFNYEFYWLFSIDMGGWIAVAWMTLILSGAWRAERNWIDRLGRAIGVFWILADITASLAWKLWLW
jgi:hypothetical protein